MSRHGRLRAACALAIGLALGGCSAFGDTRPPPPCPRVYLIDDTSRLTQFRPGSGRDITDIDFQSEIVAYAGSCVYEDKKMTMDLNVAFDVTRGPANASHKATFRYFVAIPKTYPSPAGKRVFDVTVNFQPNQSHARFTDEIEVDVPVDKPAEGPSYEIYLGMQLTPDELDYNRKHRER